MPDRTLIDPPRFSKPPPTQVDAPGSFEDSPTPVERFPLSDHVDTPILLTERKEPEGVATPVPSAQPDPEGAERAGELVQSWASEYKHRRPLPPVARAALGIAGIFVVSAVLMTRCGGGPAAQRAKTEALYEDLVVSDDSLRRRREATPDDFRSTAPAADATAVVAAPAKGAPATPSPADNALEQRRARRRNNPEDVRYKGGKLRRTKRKGREPRPDDDGVEDIAIVTTRFQSSAPKKAPVASAAFQLAAGTTLRARLTAPLRVRGSSATVAVRITDKRLKGARALGAVRADRDGYITIRFRRLILRDGRELRIEGEARDLEGQTGLIGQVSGATRDEGPGTGETLARGSARRAIGGLGGGLVTGAAGDALRLPRSRSRRSRSTVYLPKSTKLRVFLVRGVRSKDE